MRREINVYGLLSIVSIVSSVISIIFIVVFQDNKTVQSVSVGLMFLFAVLFVIFLILYFKTKYALKTKNKAIREKEKFENDLLKQKMLIDAEIEAKEKIQFRICGYCGAKVLTSSVNCSSCGAKK